MWDISWLRDGVKSRSDRYYPVNIRPKCFPLRFVNQSARGEKLLPEELSIPLIDISIALRNFYATAFFEISDQILCLEHKSLCCC